MIFVKFLGLKINKSLYKLIHRRHIKNLKDLVESISLGKTWCSFEESSRAFAFLKINNIIDDLGIAPSFTNFRFNLICKKLKSLKIDPVDFLPKVFNSHPDSERNTDDIKVAIALYQKLQNEAFIEILEALEAKFLEFLGQQEYPIALIGVGK